LIDFINAAVRVVANKDEKGMVENWEMGLAYWKVFITFATETSETL